MPTLDVKLLRVDGETVSLAGCEQAVEGEDGMLVLTFAADAAGLAALEEWVAEEVDVSGTMTVLGPGRATEYDCTLVERRDRDVVFQLVCLDD